jgi:DNA ligase-1
VHIQSRQGKPYNIPHLQEWANKHKNLLPLDGELYCHKELTFQEIISAVKKVSALTKSIRFVAYDRPISGVNNNDRWNQLITDFSSVEKDAPIYLSDWTLCCSMQHIEDYHEECVSKGYEGVIIRNLNGKYEFGFRSNDLIKMKTFDDAEFEIIDVVEATGRDAGTAVFVCECAGGEFNVKPQGTRELRAEYFKNRKRLIGKKVTVQYQGLSDDGIPRFPSAISVRDYE